MNQLEENIVNSFRLAKSDIIRLQNGFLKLSQTQERMLEMLNRLDSNQVNLYNRVKKSKRATKSKTKTIVKTVTKRANKNYVAAKGGNKFHIESCPFAQNIKPKNRVKFKSRIKALNEGLKACKCVA